MHPEVFTMVAQVAVESHHSAWPLMMQMPWFGWIAIVAILSGCVNIVVTTVAKHRERMAMLRLGMHPDASPTDPQGKPFVRPDEL